MFVFGEKISHIGTEQLHDEKCPKCGDKDNMTIAMLSAYYHLFWIPLFPFRKYGAAHCGNCENAIGKRNMSESVARAYENARQKIKFPWWNFLGIILIPIFYLSFLGYDAAITKLEQHYITSPKKGDIYIISNFGFSSLKVISYNDSLVALKSGMNTVYSEKSIHNLNNTTFTDTVYYYKEQLLEMYEKGIIYSIRRK